ncbi:hypothetical protein LEA_17683, partial [human gut metagenome]
MNFFGFFNFDGRFPKWYQLSGEEEQMQNITGKIAFGGIAIGKIKEISKENNVVRRVKIEDAKAEIARFEAARDQAAEELKGLY